MSDCPTLLCVRMPPDMVRQLRECPGLVDVFKVVSVGQHAADDLRDWIDDTRPEQGKITRRLYESLARACNITHAIIAQPLHPYSERAAEALEWQGARIFWTERYFDDRAMLDEIGCQYTAKNEILAYECRADLQRETVKGNARTNTRYWQPERRAASSLIHQYGPPDRTLVVFGQVGGDMALRDTSGGVGYDQWLRMLIEENRDRQILFKAHPLAPCDRPHEEGNVRWIEENIYSLFTAYPCAAAYSSTVILEGMALGVRFATGGHHFMSGLTYRITDRESAGDLVNRLRNLPYGPDERAAVWRRLSFIENRYTMRLDDPRALARLLAPDVAEFYRGGQPDVSDPGLTGCPDPA